MEIYDVLEGVEYEVLCHGKRAVEVQGIAIDSREVREGYIFVCIKGLHDDGHAYIGDAVRQGAIAVVCDRKDIEVPDSVTVILVESARHALNSIAGNFYGNPSKRMRIIGVTGTNGKTSITYFLERVLEECGYTVGIIGTAGAKTGSTKIDIPYKTATTPDTIELHAIFEEMAKRGTNYVVMEVSSHSLELDKVGSIDFAAGIFTNLTQDHLDFHKTMDNYLRAKAKLFDYCRVGIVNGDDNASEFLLDYAAGKTQMYTYGIESPDSKPSDFAAKNVVLAANGVSFDLTVNGGTTHFNLPIPGRFSVYNALAVISTALALKLPLEKIQTGISKITTIPGRFQHIPNDKNINVIVDYAHSPDGLQNIITAVREFTKNSVITVFGCGGDRDTGKRPIMGKIVGGLSDFCIITSDNPRNEDPLLIISEIESGLLPTRCPYLKLPDRREAILKSLSVAKPGDTVIIAGKGDEDYQEFENRRRIHFNDFDVAFEALNP